VLAWLGGAWEGLSGVRIIDLDGPLPRLMSQEVTDTEILQAGSAREVEGILRARVSQNLGRRVKVSSRLRSAHIDTAREIADALVELSDTYPGARFRKLKMSRLSWNVYAQVNPLTKTMTFNSRYAAPESRAYLLWTLAEDEATGGGSRTRQGRSHPRVRAPDAGNAGSVAAVSGGDQAEATPPAYCLGL
jgi:hypothetical protein